MSPPRLGHQGLKRQMAKYSINYACGHGSVVKQLYGPHKDRDRYVEWAESNLVCRDCYVAKAKAADAKAEQIIFIETVGLTMTLTARASGRIDEHKGTLKAAGFEWTRDYGGAMALLSGKEPPLALVKSHKYADATALEAWLREITDLVAPLGYRIESNVNPLDIAVWQEASKRRAETVAEHPRPERPAYYAEWMTTKGSQCNGKVYGSKGRRCIYVAPPGSRDGKRYDLTDDQAAEMEQYFAALAAHRKAAGS